MNATTKLAGTAAIEAFTSAARDGQSIKVWSLHRVGEPAGKTQWGSEEWVDLLLEEATEESGYRAGTWEAASWDGKSLEIEAVDGWRYSLWYEDSPDEGRRRIAYLGAHCGFEWEDCPEKSWHLNTLLRYLSWDDEALAKIGLASIEDDTHGDDGGFWVVADETKFAAVSRGCIGLADTDKEEELDGEAILDAVA